MDPGPSLTASAGPMVIYQAASTCRMTGHRRPLAGTKSYRSVTAARVCERREVQLPPVTPRIDQ